MSSSSGRRKFVVRHPVVVDVGCNCRRARKLSSFFTSFQTSSKPKTSLLHPPQNPSAHHHHHHPLSSYYPFSPSTATGTTTTSIPSSWETSHNPSSSSAAASPYEEDAQATPLKKNRRQRQLKKGGNAGRVGESVAVVKVSSDPYVDFRESMVQMIVEKEIYGWEELKELLHYLLALNSPYHHDAIVHAFAEIWNDLFSPSATSAATGSL